MEDNMAAKATKDYFDLKGVHSVFPNDEKNKLALAFELENMDSLQMILYFAEDNDICRIRSYNVAKFPEGKIDKMYRICNEINMIYSWAKFMVDESDNTIFAEVDAAIQLDNCGEVVLHFCNLLAVIIDDAYPVFMKGIWGE